ncbi:MAG: lysine--tRNA ligase [Candidatus Dormibacteraeota bacterium]|nr:lysine--tRNA ligase [Candidatus Dormibacteraeota bacterium]
MEEEQENLPEVLRARREKLRRIQEAGGEGYARAYRRTHTTKEAHELLGEGDGPTEPVRVAGRLVGLRPHGGMTFADLQDASGRIQLAVRRDTLGEARQATFNDLDLGDIIGVEGPVFRTRRGEVSVSATDFTLLTKSLRPLPEKWHGLKDTDTRYRRRYLDLIANPEVVEVFRARTRVITAIRRLYDERGFLEVETPVLHDIPGGGHATPFVTHHQALHRDLYLRIALELYLKRLTVGGLEKVYEIGRVFRNEGLSPRHNPEFTMLESYEAYSDLEGQMDLVEAILRTAAEAAGRPLQGTYQGEPLDLTPPYRRARMQDLVRDATGQELAGAALMDAYEDRVEPALRNPTFVVDYPVEVSPLARRRADDPRFVERFELVVAGRELANAFTELTDAVDQRRRFEEQAAARRAGDEEAHPFDEDFIQALEVGLPPTGGMGMGIDRLVALLTDQPALRDVILFPQLRERND